VKELRFIPAAYPGRALISDDVFETVLRDGIARHGIALKSKAFGARNGEKVWVLGIELRDGSRLTLNVDIWHHEFLAVETCDYLIWRLGKFAVEGE
jgi:hypothetical protein